MKFGPRGDRPWPEWWEVTNPTSAASAVWRRQEPAPPTQMHRGGGVDAFASYQNVEDNSNLSSERRSIQSADFKHLTYPYDPLPRRQTSPPIHPDIASPVKTGELLVTG